LLTDAHLHLCEYSDGDVIDVLESARNQGVMRFVTAALDADTAALDHRRAEAYGNDVVRVVGVHPWRADTADKESCDRLRSIIQGSVQVVGIGEIGLDTVRGGHARSVQLRALDAMLGLAEESRKPVLLHADRISEHDHRSLLGIVAERRIRSGVVHGFAADRAIAEAWLRTGFLLSFSGSVTWSENAWLRDIAALVPADRLLTESDSPAAYEPESARGSTNAPKFVRSTLNVLSQIRKMLPEQLEEQIAANLSSVFPFGDERTDKGGGEDAGQSC